MLALIPSIQDTRRVPPSPARHIHTQTHKYLFWFLLRFYRIAIGYTRPFAARIMRKRNLSAMCVDYVRFCSSMFSCPYLGVPQDGAAGRFLEEPLSSHRRTDRTGNHFPDFTFSSPFPQAALLLAVFRVRGASLTPPATSASNVCFVLEINAFHLTHKWSKERNTCYTKRP